MARSRSRSPSPRHRSRRDSQSHRQRHGHGREDSRRSPSEDRHGDRSRKHSRHERQRKDSPSPDGRYSKRIRRDDRQESNGAVPTSDPPAVGAILEGKVHTIKPFGLFVTLNGYQRHGLVHHSQVSEEVSFGQEDEDDDKITALEYFFPQNARVCVKVTEVQNDDRGGVRIGCSIKAVDQETGKDLDPGNKLTARTRGGGGGGMRGPLREGAPEINSVHKSEVASIKPFGVFVRLEGYRTNGLVHVSQVSDHMNMDREDSDEAKIAAIGQVLGIGESIWVKVVEIKDADPGSDRGPKVGCSIKLVSQRDGTDLDPHGLKHRPKPTDGGEFGKSRTVGADVGKVQQGTIDWGHLNAEKVNLNPQSSGYEILGAEAEDIGSREPAHQPGLLPPPPTKGLKKQQKLQKSGITSVEEAMAVLKEHKKKEKHTKTKKEKKGKKGKKEKKSKKSKRKTQSSSSDS